MKGCRYSGMLTGKDATHDDNITIHIMMERDDYQMPDYRLGESRWISGYKTGITIISLTMITTIIISAKKKKNGVKN